jgi:MTH538 TIR-like domain (DUF1863)
MARQVFFSFHYQRDIWRVNQVRNSPSFQENDEAIFFDHSLWEETKCKGDAALRRLIDDGLRGASVTAVLIGSQTATRRWVKYEIEKSYADGKGLLGVYIHRIKDSNGTTDYKGTDPFSSLPIDVATYDWVSDDGYNNFAKWAEKAAQAVGK